MLREDITAALLTGLLAWAAIGCTVSTVRAADRGAGLQQLPFNRWVKLHVQQPDDTVHFQRQAHGGSCFDTRRGQLILFGSNTHGQNWYNSPFAFDPVERRWSQFYPHDPRDTYTVDADGVGVAGSHGDHPWAMHTFGAVVYDPIRDAMLVASEPKHMVPGRFTDTVADLWPRLRRFPTWEFDLERKQWHALSCEAISFFPFCAVYDSRCHVVLGHRPDGIYALGGQPRRWERLTDRVFHSGWHTNAVFDTNRHAMIVFGTNTNSNAVEVFYHETGEHRQMPTPGRRPPADQHNPMAFDTGCDRTVVLVDHTIGDAQPATKMRPAVTETWLYDLAGDRWSQVSSATLPFACGMNYNMEFDPLHGCLLLVTGGPSGGQGTGAGPTTVWALRLRPENVSHDGE